MDTSSDVPTQYQHLYRYGSLSDNDRVTADERCAWLEGLLLRHELYVPLASQLNDLRDAGPRLARASADEIKTLFRQHLPMLRIDLSADERQELIHNIDKHIDDSHIEPLLERARALLHEFWGSTIRIYSMSKRWDNLSMWQWYADRFRGYCIEFQRVQLPDPSTIREVVYTDEPLSLHWTTPSDESNIGLRFSKHRDWSNEQEVRLFLRIEAAPVLHLTPHAISRVILGKDLSPRHVSLLREWGARRQPSLPIVTTRWNAFDAKLEIVALDA
jgi:hypothetical protein